MKHQLEEQKSLYHAQDETLDVMTKNVDQLNDYAVAIGTELDEQKVLLDEFGNEMTSVQSRLDHVLGGMQRLLRTKSK